MKNKSRKGLIGVIIILLLANILTLISSPALLDVRSIDILKIFVCGLLFGVLIFVLRGVYFDKKSKDTTSS